MNGLKDRLFWFFAIIFFAVALFVAVYMHETAIAAILGYLLGSTIEQLDIILKLKKKNDELKKELDHWPSQ
jgi:hypothetical protein